MFLWIIAPLVVLVIIVLAQFPKKKGKNADTTRQESNHHNKSDKDSDVSIYTPMMMVDTENDGGHKRYHDTDLSSQSYDAGPSSHSYDGGGSDGGGGGGGE